MELGKKIKHLRFQAGLTQEQLAEKLGIGARSVSKWENAVRPKTGRTRLQLRLKIQYLQSPEYVWAGRHGLCLSALSAKKRGGRRQSMARSVHLDH